MKKVGTLAAIFRHPVKAMRGERLTTCRVDAFGVYGDRGYYFRDESRNGKCLSADAVPGILGYTARLAGESGEDAYPEVRVTAPDGTVYGWEETLFAKVAETTGRPVTAVRSTPREGGENWEDHVLLVTDASLREIARLVGRESLDPRRFRANFVVVLDEDTPFAEDAWLGRRLRINDVELQVNKPCERCMSVNIDPDRLEIHPAVLKTVVKRHRNHFGVYASVVTQGRVAEGDEVFVEEP